MKTFIAAILCLCAGLCSAQTNTRANNGTFSGNVSVGGTLGVTGVASFKNLEGVRYADQFTGGSAGAQINAAVANCPAYNNASTDIGCIVVIPNTMACGEGNQAPDNVLLIDERGCAQSQGLRFNVGVAATAIRSKELLQDNYDLTTIGATGGGHGAVTHYVLSFPNNPNTAANTVEAGNYTISSNTINGNMTLPFVGLEAEAFARPAAGGGFSFSDIRAFTANADCTPTAGSLTCGQMVSVYAQAPTKGVGATVTNAYSVVAESPTAGATDNYSYYSKGDIRLDGTLYTPVTNTNGSALVIGTTTASPGTAIFVRPQSNLTGSVQAGIQVAPITSSAATSNGIGARFRADTAAASFTQTLNTAVLIDTATVGAGSAITTAKQLQIAAAPTAGTKFGISQEGSADVNRFAGPMDWTETTAPAGAGSNTRCYADSTAHALKCSYNNVGYFPQTQTIGSSTVTTAGTAVTNGTCQAQTGITITGATTTDVGIVSLNAAIPATWQTGINWATAQITANTCTISLCNGTAGSITPAATALRCTVVR